MEFVEQLKASVDIVKVVQEYVPRLRRSSPTRYVGLCPFHTEKTPSFSVHAGHQFYKCFGCGAGGDVLKFVMEIERITFYEALRLLSERHGIPMPKRAEYSDPDTKLRAAIYRMHELAEQSFREQLASSAGAEARAYIQKRGVAPEVVEQFGLGYSDRSGRQLVRLFEKHSFTPEQMEGSGLVLKRTEGGFYDRFRHRLMFPIHNEMGKVVAFGGRALDAAEPAKYINSSETVIYHKSSVLYNLHRAKEGLRKTERAVLVEGYMDAIGVFSAGVHEVVASCGTALTTQHIQTLKRHTGRVIVNFDPDTAGANAAERSIQTLLEEGMHVRIVELDGGLDPDEYCKERGAEAYQARVEGAKGYFYWLADRARTKFDMRSAEGRVAGFQYLLPAIQRLSDKLERVAVVNDVAGYLGVDASLVLENFRKAAAERREKTVQAAPQSVRPVESILLQLLLEQAEARERIIPALRALPATSRFTTQRIFDTIFALFEAGEPIGFSEVDARLGEEDRVLLASAVLGDGTHDQSLTLDQGLACLRALEAASHQDERSALKARVKSAERDGNLNEALRLAEELSRMERA